MAARLTFHPRRGLLEATAASLALQLPVHRDSTRITRWEHQYEFPPGRHTLWDATLDVAGRTAITTGRLIYLAAPGTGPLAGYDYPGEYAQRFDGIDKGGTSHSSPGSALYVGTRTSGVFIHGWPACTGQACIVVMRQWDDLRRALSGERRLAFSVFV